MVANTTDKEERDRLVEKFKDKFEECFNYRPSMRRTKSGSFMFDEGGDHEIIVGNLPHAVYYFGERGLNWDYFSND